MGYTIWPDGPTGDILSLVNKERYRQYDLIQQGKFEWACNAVDMPCRYNEPNPFTKLAVLAEEFGEVSQIVCRHINGPLEVAELKKELIQVAAVCVAWAESLP